MDATLPHRTPRPEAARRGRALAALVLAGAAVALAGRAATYTGWYQRRVYARASLTQLAAAVKAHPGSSLALYYYGRALDAHGRYTEALVPLEQAAGLDPDDADVRREWSTAQLAGGYITGAFGQLTQFVRTHPNSARGHLALGRFYVAQNANARAVEELDAAARLDPGIGEAWSLLAGARLAMGGVVEARDAARKAVSLRPASSVDHLMLGSLLLRTNDRTGARREYARAAELAPRDPAYLREYARLLLKYGDAADLSLAEKLARQAIALDPNSPDGYHLLGRALAQQGKVADAVAPLTTAATMLPPGTPRSTLPENAPEQFLDAATALEVAHTCRALGRTADAARWEQEYLRRQRAAEERRRAADDVQNHPDRPDARQAMARCLARRGDVLAVAKQVGEMRGLAPDAPRTLVETANLLTRAGYGAQAAPLARRATMFSRNSPEAYEAWGNGLLAMGQPHEASVEYAKAAGWWTNRVQEFKARIAAYYRQRRLHPPEAERLYQQAVALESARFGPTYSTNQVKALLERAVALEPLNTDYRRYLLRALFGRRDHDDAVREARALLSISPDDGVAHALLALLLLEQAKSPAELADAEKHLKDAEAAEVDDADASIAPTVHYGEGILALRRGDSREAVRLLRQAAAEDPSADMTYYQLAEAERLAGDAAAARAAAQEYAGRTARKREELDLLRRIGALPGDRARYEAAARFYRHNGMEAKAIAVEAEMRRRFGPGASASG